jgi:hypothetical protein
MISSSNADGLHIGAWRLDSLLGMRDGLSYYTATHNTSGMRALVQLIEAGNERARRLLRSWRLASGLKNAQILNIYETGEVTRDGTPVVYAALDLPEEDLTDRIAAGTMDFDEAWALTETVSRGLQQLHAAGLRHGAVEPSNLLVVGGQVKLSVDTLAPAEPEDREADLREMSTTLLQALTGETEVKAAYRTPEPLQGILLGCLGLSGQPWTADRVVAAMRHPEPEPALPETHSEAVSASPEPSALAEKTAEEVPQAVAARAQLPLSLNGALMEEEVRAEAPRRVTPQPVIPPFPEPAALAGDLKPQGPLTAPERGPIGSRPEPIAAAGETTASGVRPGSLRTPFVPLQERSVAEETKAYSWRSTAPGTVRRRRGPSFFGPYWKWAAVLAVVVGVAIGWMMLPKASRGPAASPGSSASASGTPTVAKAPAGAAPAPLPPSSASPAPVPRRTGSSQNHWALIAATYSSHRAAENRAKTLAQRSRGLHPHVYPKEGGGNRYYVVLQSGMSRKEADQARRKFIARGAPRDTYVTKLEETETRR